MSVQADTKAAPIRERPHIKKAMEIPPEYFHLRGQLLDQGRFDNHIVKTANLAIVLKVYASGGENALHTHMNEDHVFVIMQGTARFYDAEGTSCELGKNGGILLPAGAYYWFEATSSEPLVILRVGVKLDRSNPDNLRVDLQGKPLHGQSAENKTVPVIFREGAFFE